MSEILNETLPVVNAVNKSWVDFSDNQATEKQVDSMKDDKQDNDSSIIQLPRPPRKNSKSADDKHDSSIQYSTNSPLSKNSQNKLAHVTRDASQFTGKSINRPESSVRLNDNLTNYRSTEIVNECALDTMETSIKSNFKNLQNVPLKENTSVIESLNPQSNSKFKNGDIIVSLLPLNTHCSWITPALFKPELVPEELMSPEFRLTVEDYVQSMSMLINDYRFNLYIVFYKKVTLIWLTLGFCILFSLLFSNAEGVILFFGMLIWILINAFGFLLTYWMKVKMIRNLEKCLASVNEQFYKNNIILAVEDKGRLSCHKINLIFMYFDSTNCIKHLNTRLNRDGEVDLINNTINNLNQLNNNNNNTVDLNKNTTSPHHTIDMLQQDVDIDDIIITGSTPIRLSKSKECYGEKLFLRYSQRWAIDFTKQRIGFNTPLHSDSSVTPPINIQPRHCEKARCVCQYIEDHLAFKPYHHCSLEDFIG